MALSLNLQVPLWSVEDVLCWVRRAGFGAFAEAFQESGVDGDMLLQLDESNLKSDLGIENGILRKRFARELTSLKKCADYSAVDRHGIAAFLGAIDHKTYTYGLIMADMSPDFMRRLSSADLDDMLKEAGVTSAVHRRQIIESILEDNSNNSSNSFSGSHNLSNGSLTDLDGLDGNEMFDVYISYAGHNHGSKELASLLTVHLQLRGLTVFNPSEHLDLSQKICDTESCVLAASASALKRCRNLVMVLGDGALDGCLNNSANKEKVYREIVAALAAKDCNIVPVTEADFQFPDPDELPEDIRALCYFNSVRWVHDYQEACVDKLERFLRGEAFLRAAPPSMNLYAAAHGLTPGSKTPMLTTQTSSRSRADSGRSSPRLTPLKVMYRNRNDSIDSAISP